MKRLDSKKVSKSNDTPFRIIKEISECLNKAFFSDERKCVEVVPVYKK